MIKAKYVFIAFFILILLAVSLIMPGIKLEVYFNGSSLNKNEIDLSNENTKFEVVIKNESPIPLVILYNTCQGLTMPLGFEFKEQVENIYLGGNCFSNMYLTKWISPGQKLSIIVNQNELHWLNTIEDLKLKKFPNNDNKYYLNMRAVYYVSFVDMEFPINMYFPIRSSWKTYEIKFPNPGAMK